MGLKSRQRLERRAPGAGLGLDLKGESGKARLLRAGLKRRRSAMEEEVAEEQRLLAQRVQWLVKKVERLPLNSNGRKKAQAEGQRLLQFGGLLQMALNGDELPKEVAKLTPEYARTRYEARAIRLLKDLDAIT